MTDIKVSDEVVQIAIDAYHALPARTTFHDSMRAAIKTAVESMIVPAHFATDGAGDLTLFAEFTDLDQAYAYAGDDGWVVEAYAIRNQGDGE
jgi:hypothetical protein